MNIPRYIIVLDRPDDCDYAGDGHGYGHDGSAKAACEQVARELQEAITATGQPAGFFNVIDRRRIPAEERVAMVTDPAELAASLGLERKMEND